MISWRSRIFWCKTSNYLSFWWNRCWDILSSEFLAFVFSQSEFLLLLISLNLLIVHLLSFHAYLSLLFCNNSLIYFLCSYQSIWNSINASRWFSFSYLWLVRRFLGRTTLLETLSSFRNFLLLQGLLWALSLLYFHHVIHLWICFKRCVLLISHLGLTRSFIIIVIPITFFSSLWAIEIVCIVLLSVYDIWRLKIVRLLSVKVFVIKSANSFKCDSESSFLLWCVCWQNIENGNLIMTLSHFLRLS